MNVIDVAIGLFILSFGVVGMKKGFFKSAVSLIGTLFIFMLAFYLKDPLADFISIRLPFLNFGEIVSLNIVFYQFISFIIILSLLSIVLRIVLKFVGGLEKVLKWTIVLGIPSRILGLLVGLVEGYVLVFIMIFMLYQPFINIDIVNQSKLAPKILNSSPGLSNVINKTNNAINDVYKEIKDYNYSNKNALNLSIIKLLLKYEVINTNYLQKLVNADKLNINGIESIIKNGG